jgi:hypothetical protein
MFLQFQALTAMGMTVDTVQDQISFPAGVQLFGFISSACQTYRTSMIGSYASRGLSLNAHDSTSKQHMISFDTV